MLSVKANNAPFYLMETQNAVKTGSWNDILITGCYSVGLDVTDAPERGFWMALVLSSRPRGGGDCAQVAFKLIDPKGARMFVRLGNTGGFGDWKEVTLTELAGGGS